MATGGCGLGDRSTTQPQELFCDQGAQRLMLVTSKAVGFTARPTRTYSNTRDRI